MNTIATKSASLDAIIFDVTGTMIDMDRSLVRAIEMTVNNYFNEPVLTAELLWRTRRLAGYNNEWDTTYALVVLMEARTPEEDWTTAAQNLLPINRTDSLYCRLRDVFQTYYLGSELFERLEKTKPPFACEPGLRLEEKRIVSKELIVQLKAAGYKVGIATGCPRAEVLISLRAQGLLGPDYFEPNDVVGLEDTLLNKPDPAPLLEAKRRLGARNALYVGDSLSDIEAARRAGMPCLYVGDQDSEEGAAFINGVLRCFI